MVTVTILISFPILGVFSVLSPLSSILAHFFIYHLYYVVLVSLCCGGKIPWPRQFKQEEFVLAYGSRERVHKVEGAWRQAAGAGS